MLYSKHSSSVFTYPVKVIKFAEFSLQDLIDNDMILLVPIFPARFRKKVEKLNKEGNLLSEANNLKKEMFSDIVDAINECHNKGKIDRIDAGLLVTNTIYIYNYLYSNYDELRRDDMESTEYKWLGPALGEARQLAEIAKDNSVLARDDAEIAKDNSEIAKDLATRLNEELKKTQDQLAHVTQQLGTVMAFVGLM
jgi:Skp family chaperone for outer membrane proteins